LWWEKSYRYETVAFTALPEMWFPETPKCLRLMGIFHPETENGDLPCFFKPHAASHPEAG
jgi:hypothetical protein